MQDPSGFEKAAVAAMAKLGRSSKTNTTVQECLLQLAVILMKVEVEGVLRIYYLSRKVPSVDGSLQLYFCLKTRR